MNKCQIKQLKQVCNIPSQKDYPNIKDECYLFSVEAYDNCKQPERKLVGELGSSKNMCYIGNVLFCKMNPRNNRVWYIEKTDIYDLPLLCSSEFIPLEPYDVNPSYLSFYLQSNAFKKQVAKYVRGATKSRERINPIDFMKINIPIPDNQLDIASYVSHRLITVRKIKTRILEQDNMANLLEQAILNETFDKLMDK
jgi:type I restriction enzyme, S subunit